METWCESSCSFVDLEDIEEKIYLKRKLISSLEEIKKFRAINTKLEEESKTFK